MNPPPRLPWSRLVQVSEPLLPTFQKWVRGATNPVEVLPANPDPAGREEAIECVQADRASLLGTIAWDTGGLWVDQGFIRILGSGHPKMGASLATWNRTPQAAIIVGYDVIGGMFAIDGGALGTAAQGNVAYFAPDQLAWVDMKVDYAQFMLWVINGSTDAFYGPLRWPTWKRDVSRLPGTMGWRFEPPFSQEAPPEGRARVPSPIQAMLMIQLSHVLKARLPKP